MSRYDARLTIKHTMDVVVEAPNAGAAQQAAMALMDVDAATKVEMDVTVELAAGFEGGRQE